MLTLFLFFLASFGLSEILTKESITDKIRNWINKVFPNSFVNHLLACNICTSFWVGIGLYFVFTLPIITGYMIMNAILYGCISLAVNKILLLTINKLF